MATSSTSKVKSTDRSTTWSECKLDSNRQQWYSTRKNENGENECYYYPAETTTAQDTRSIVLRTFEHKESQSQLPYAPPTVQATPYDQAATSAYNPPSTSSTQYSRSAGYTTGESSEYTDPDPYEYPTTSFSNVTNAAYPAATTTSFGATAAIGQTHGTWSSYESPKYSSFEKNASSNASATHEDARADGLDAGMGALSLTSQPTAQSQGRFEAAYSGQCPSGSSKELDSRYVTIEPKKQKHFWRVGRVFMMLWTEPAQAQQINPNGGARNSSHYSITWLNETAYSEIRRFVVIRAGHGSCICSPIHTYSKQATLKPNLPERLQHAIIYTGATPPEEHSYVASDGTIVQENLTKDPIKVIREQKAAEGDLGPYSRLNYSKIYTVEHYTRVLNIGMVHESSLTSLEANSYIRPPTGPPERPVQNPAPARPERRKSGGSKEKNKSRGGKKPSEDGGGRRRH